MSLCREMVLGELAGKNNAIHAYDKIAWTIRTGYLTLLFGGWAIVLKGALDAGSGFRENRGLFAAMLILSIGFAAGAVIVDRSYVRRKFRVIASLNALLSNALEIQDVDHPTAAEKDALHLDLRVAGDAYDKSYRVPAYRQAVWAELGMYLVSLVAVAAAGWPLLS